MRSHLLACLRAAGYVFGTGFILGNRSMMHLEIGGERIPVAAGETVIGSAPGCAIVLEGEGVRPRHAVVQGTPEGAAAIRAAGAEAEVSVNGVRLGADPTPVLHGDKIQIGRPRDPGGGPPPRGQHPALRLRRLRRPRAAPASQATRGATGGRLVCLTDGREYTWASIRSCSAGTRARMSWSPGSDVSRQHAEIRAAAEGYVLMDLSVNGTYVNGERMGKTASARPGRRDPDRERRVPLLRRRRAAGSDARAAAVPSVTAAAAADRRGRAAVRHDARSPAVDPRARSAVTPPPPSRAAARIAAGAERRPARAGGCRSRCRWSTSGRADYNDIVIADPSVSTIHAKLQRRDESGC